MPNRHYSPHRALLHRLRSIVPELAHASAAQTSAISAALAQYGSELERAGREGYRAQRMRGTCDVPECSAPAESMPVMCLEHAMRLTTDALGRDYSTRAEAAELLERLGQADDDERTGLVADYLCDAYWEGQRSTIGDCGKVAAE